MLPKRTGTPPAVLSGIPGFPESPRQGQLAESGRCIGGLAADTLFEQTFGTDQPRFSQNIDCLRSGETAGEWGDG